MIRKREEERENSHLRGGAAADASINSISIHVIWQISANAIPSCDDHIFHRKQSFQGRICAESTHMIGWRCFCWYNTSTEFRRLDANEDHGIGQCPMITANLPNTSGKLFCRAEFVGNFGCERLSDQQELSPYFLGVLLSPLHFRTSIGNLAYYQGLISAMAGADDVGEFST
ncbi:hypothetical protein Cgig2_005567 [Carnegiea gigantea]|uniref:Uncharacterized protein n=1 Tax=Carnegiea gigantea TaxID=171969 RepID=A0A9Q1KV03_9CARY|nr:hypothetical protein Cgig2_005567 [Carnegiea gigantea]